MSDETPEIESEEEPKPRRRRRSRRKADETSEATSASETAAANVSDADVTSDAEAPGEVDESSPPAVAVDPQAVEEHERDEIMPTAEDREAQEASEVVLEADDEAEAEPEAQAPRRRRRRRGASEETSAPPAPAPTRRRARRDPDAPIPVVRAQAKYVRSSARKARLVCDNIRGRSVEDARAILAHTPRAIARDWSKLLESAVANAEHNHELVGEDLYVKAVHADEGPTIRRFRPRAMGRATKIRKRTSHLTILLTPKE
jgi:ribosomal protein L22